MNGSGCSGAPGFEHFLEVMNDPDHPEHEDLMDWYGDPFDPTDIEEETVRSQLTRLAKRLRRKD